MRYSECLELSQRWRSARGSDAKQLLIRETYRRGGQDGLEVLALLTGQDLRYLYYYANLRKLDKRHSRIRRGW